MAKISEAFAAALSHHQAGRLQAAEQIYRQILAVEPHQADAWNLLGVVQAQHGNHQAAADHILRAIELAPRTARFHCSLGDLHRTTAKPDDAVACYRRALELNPDLAEAHNNLGATLREQGKWDEAATCYRRVLELKPNIAEAHNNLGNVLKDLGQWNEAVDCFRRALQLKPQLAEVHNNLGNILQEQGRLDEAVACYERALQLKPDYFEALSHLGNALRSQAKRDEAAACYRRVLDLKPDFAEAHFILGTILREQGKRDEALACYRRAVKLKSDYGLAMSALAHELQHQCQWEDLRQISERVIDFVEEESKNAAAPPASPFAFLALSTVTTPAQQLRCARQWADRRLKSYIAMPRGPAWNRPTDRQSKLTVGYLSADFRSHPVAQLTVELFEKHDRDRFSIIGYSFGRDDGSPMRRRLVSAFDRFVDLKDSSFQESAARIAADEVQILIDLTGYTMNSREEIVALRPAPIQASFIGYTSTMGASFVDYILVDDFVVPLDQQPFYAERLVHLPGSYLTYDARQEIAPRTPSRAECGLPPAGFVFCCFNNSYKITPELFGVWMRLLQAVPDSVLWLLEGNRFAPANLRREAAARGVAAERLVFAPRVDPAEHLARHRVADLFLDTIPYNAHTTACEALWAGCPVLTITGETFSSRVAGSVLRTLGLPELITTHLDDYEQQALRLARDTRQLADIRGRVQTGKLTSGFFDGGRFAASLERAYVTMWNTYASGERPTPFRVGSA